MADFTLRQKLAIFCQVYVTRNIQQRIKHNSHYFRFDEFLESKCPPGRLTTSKSPEGRLSTFENCLEHLSDHEVSLIIQAIEMIDFENGNVTDIGLLIEALIRKKECQITDYCFHAQYRNVRIKTSDAQDEVDVRHQIFPLFERLNIRTFMCLNYLDPFETTYHRAKILSNKICLPTMIQVYDFPSSNNIRDLEHYKKVLLFWSILRSKVYLMMPLSSIAFESIISLPSPKLLKQYIHEQSDILEAIEQYSDNGHLLFYLCYTKNKNNFSSIHLELRKKIPVSSENEEINNEIYADVVRFYSKSYYITCTEQALLHSIVCTGLFEEGELNNFLVRDLYDPRVLILISQFSISDVCNFDQI